MNESIRTIFFSAAAAEAVREISSVLDKDALSGLFVTPLEATAAPGPISHYVSSGPLPDWYISLLTAPEDFYDASKAAYEAEGRAFQYTLAQIGVLLSQCEMHDGTAFEETPHAWLAQRGLQLGVGLL